jgi:type I restriction enzyme M protein
MNSQLQTSLWSLLDGLRGSPCLPQDILDALTLLALVAKQAPEDFIAIYNTGANYQRDELQSLVNKLAVRSVANIYQHNQIGRVPPNVWQKLIYFIKENMDRLNELAVAIRESLSASAPASAPESGSSESVKNLFAALVGDISNKTFYDGSAGLAQIAVALQPQKMYLEEINTNTWAISFRLLVLQGLEPSFSNCDSLINSTYPELKADVAAMQPPFGYRLGSQHIEQLVTSEMLVVDAGKKLPTSAGDVVWIQQALSKINEHGKAYLLLPQGWLFRGGYDAKVRDYLLDEDLIEAIIALPGALLHSTAIPTSVLILNKAKPKGKPIHFVDASELGKKDKRLTVFSIKEVKLIASLARGAEGSNPLYKAVYIPEIRQQSPKGDGNNLSVSQFFTSETLFELPNVEEELAKLKQCQTEFKQAQAKLNRLLNIKE